MKPSFVFGGDTGTSYDDLQRRRTLAQAMWANGGRRRPRNVADGLGNAAQSIMGALYAKKLGKEMKGEQDEFGLLYNGALAGLGGQRSMDAGGVASPFMADDQYQHEAYPIGEAGPAPQRDTATAGGKQYEMGAPVQDPAIGLIQEFEGFRETPYWDVNAHRVGFGSDTITMPDGSVQKVAPGAQVSRADAERDLQRRVSTEFVPIVRGAIGDQAFTQLNPNQRAASFRRHIATTPRHGSVVRNPAAALSATLTTSDTSDASPARDCYEPKSGCPSSGLSEPATGS